MELDKKMEMALPVFLGLLGAMICCVMVSVKGPGIIGCFAENSGRQAKQEFSDKESIPFYTELPGERYDLIRELYKSAETKNLVIDFFTRICGCRETAESILVNADANNISPALAFALAWEESRFNSQAVNSKNRDGSIDRGLFQLNNLSFPHIDTQAFFDTELNARYGMSHLRFCMDAGGTEIAALAMYNAGTGRVRSTGTPHSTLDYIHRILLNKQRIDTQFRARLADHADVLSSADNYIRAHRDYWQNFMYTESSEKLAITHSGRFRFVLLMLRS